MSTRKRIPLSKQTQPRTISNEQASRIASHLFATVEIPKVNPSQLLYTSEQWVRYGETNSFPNYLIDSVKKSAAHSSLINTRQNLIKGEGFSYSDELQEFLTSLDEEGATLDELLEGCATDMSVLETFAIAVRYNATKDRIIHLDYIDSSYVRADKNLSETGKITGWWVCADWSNTTRNVPVRYDAFNPKQVKEKTQLYFYHKRGLGQPFLPDVTYSSALMHIELAYQIGHYGLNTVLKGFFPSGVLTIKTIEELDTEAKQEYQRTIKRHMQGAENSGGLLINITPDIENMKFESLTPGDNTAIFLALQKLSVDAICTAHQANPIIAAIATEGSSLGSDGKLYRDSLAIYFNNVIRNFQKPFVAFIKRVLDFNEFTDYELEIASSALLANDVPEWFLQDYVKPEALATMYGFNKEDLISAPAPEQQIEPGIAA